MRAYRWSEDGNMEADKVDSAKSINRRELGTTVAHSLIIGAVLWVLAGNALSSNLTVSAGLSIALGALFVGLDKKFPNRI